MRAIKQILKASSTRTLRRWRKGWNMDRSVRIASSLLIVLSICVPVLERLAISHAYALDASTIRLVGDANPNLSKKFSYDAQTDAWIFNKDGMATAPANAPAGAAQAIAALKSQVGGAGKNDKSLYAVSLAADPAKGITYYDSNTGLSFSMIPRFEQRAGKEQQGRIVYPFGDGGKLVYTAKSNGMKEDIVLSHNIGDRLQYSYELNLPDTLEAKELNDGSIGVYSADPTLFGNIQYGSDSDQQKIEAARKNSPKDHLLFALPAPYIKQSDDKGVATAKADYFLDGNTLTVRASGLSTLHYPLTVDPSVVVTSSSDFTAGNNESNINFDSGQISRGQLTGGSTGTWHYTHSSTDDSTTYVSGMSTARSSHATIAYNNYLYVLGGENGSGSTASVEYAPINTNGTIGTWSSTTSLSAVLRDFGAVAYNGYMYTLGGYDTALSTTVQYAPINSSTGALGSWASTTSLSTARLGLSATVYNDYLYVLGGTNGSSMATVQYAPINADGTIGSWTATTSLTSARSELATAVYNGYVYVLGGDTGSLIATVEYAPINTDGTIGAWITTTSFSTARYTHVATVYKGYIYVYGGYGGGYRNDVQYAQLNANGSVGAWAATSSMIAGRQNLGGTIYNGYVYATGGYDLSYHDDVEYAKIDPAGQVGNYTTSANLMTGTQGLANPGTVVYNGYIYAIGGFRSSAYQSSVYRATLGSDGSIGTWAATTSMGSVSGAFPMAVYNGYVYVLGGFTASGVSTDVVQYGAFNADGSITWGTTTSLPAAIANHSAFAYDGYMFVVGGSGAGFSANVRVAPINSDGTLGSWTDQTNTIITGRINEMMAIYNGYMYIAGGNKSGTYYNTVEYAPLNTTSPATAADVVGSFTQINSMNEGRNAFGFFVNKGYLYAVGGQNSGSVDSSTTEYAKINSDGTLGTWTYLASMTDTRANFGFAVASDKIYLVNGSINGSRSRSSNYMSINNGGTGVTGTWTTNATSLAGIYANGWAYGQMYAYNGYMYALGGQNGNGNPALATVYYAPISADGSIGSWTATNSMNGARYGFGFAYANGYMYVLGGVDATGAKISTVEYAKINSNGTVASWTTSGNSISSVKNALAGVYYNGYIYALGGVENTTFYSTVEYASVNASTGAVGSWTSTTSLPVAMAGGCAFSYHGYMYMVGGSVGASSTIVRTVYYAPINSSNGTIGTWKLTSSLPLNRGFGSLEVRNGQVYVAGGYDQTSYDTVVSAYINSDGTLSNWHNVGTYTTTRYGIETALYKGILYVAGGKKSTGAYTDIQYATVLLQPKISHYSKLVDLGSSYTVSSVSYNGTLSPVSTVQVRSAGSAGTFGSLQDASSYSDGAVGCTAGSTRYIWLLATIDDSRVMSYGPSDSVSNLTDVTVNYGGSSRPDPNVRLRGGKYFSSESLQPLDTCGP